MDETRARESWKSLGRWLLRARESQEYSLAEAEEATRIRRKFLAALEAGEWRELPSEVVGRGFLRNYARFLGLDPQEAQTRLTTGRPSPPAAPLPTVAEAVAQEEDEEEEEAPAPDPGPAVLQRAEAVPSPTSPPRQEPVADYDLLEESLFEPKGVPWLRIVGTVVLVLVLAAVGAGSWAYWNNPELLVSLGLLQPTPSPTPTTPIARVTRITATPSDTPTITPTPTHTPTVRPTRTSTPTGTDTPTVRATPAAGLEVFVHVIDRSWLEVFTDDRRAFVGLLEPGEDQAWRATTRASMTIGNGGGLEFTINGERVGLLGERDEVVLVTWELEEGGRILQMRITPTAEVPTAEATAQP